MIGHDALLSALALTLAAADRPTRSPGRKGVWTEMIGSSCLDTSKGTLDWTECLIKFKAENLLAETQETHKKHQKLTNAGSLDLSKLVVFTWPPYLERDKDLSQREGVSCNMEVYSAPSRKKVREVLEIRMDAL